MLELLVLASVLQFEGGCCLDTYLAVSHLKNIAESFSVSPSASISIALELLLDSLGHLIQTLCGGIRLE